MQQDDLDAFEAFFVRHRGPVYRAAYALTGDRQLAEEILQETFTRAHQHRENLRTDVSPVLWLHRVAINLCYDTLRRKRPTTSPLDLTVHERLLDPDDEPAEQVEREELRHLVREAIRALPEKHQIIVVLFYLDRRSLPEIAELLGIQLGTVKSRLHYALTGLRSHLEADRRFIGTYRREAVEGEAG